MAASGLEQEVIERIGGGARRGLEVVRVLAAQAFLDGLGAGEFAGGARGPVLSELRYARGEVGRQSEVAVALGGGQRSRARAGVSSGREEDLVTNAALVRGGVAELVFRAGEQRGRLAERGRAAET